MTNCRLACSKAGRAGRWAYWARICWLARAGDRPGCSWHSLDSPELREVQRRSGAEEAARLKVVAWQSDRQCGQAERGARRTAAMKARVSQGSQSGAGSAESGGKYQGRQPSPVWFAAQATLHSNKQADWV